MEAISRDEPVPAQLLLETEGELLNVRMLCIVCDVIDANWEHRATAPEGIFERYDLASLRIRQEVTIRGKRRTVKGMEWEDSAIQERLQQRHFRHHTVVVNSVTAA